MTRDCTKDRFGHDVRVGDTILYPTVRGFQQMPVLEIYPCGGIKAGHKDGGHSGFRPDQFVLAPPRVKQPMNREDALTLADKILALVNSSPYTPRREEIAELILDDRKRTVAEAFERSPLSRPAAAQRSQVAAQMLQNPLAGQEHEERLGKVRFDLPAEFVRKYSDVLNGEEITRKGLLPGDLFHFRLDAQPPATIGPVVSLRVAPDAEGRLGLTPADKETVRLVAEEAEAIRRKA